MKFSLAFANFLANFPSSAPLVVMQQLETLPKTNEDTVGDLVTVLRRHLLSEWTRQKTPYGLDTTLAATIDARPDATENIFSAHRVRTLDRFFPRHHW